MTNIENLNETANRYDAKVIEKLCNERNVSAFAVLDLFDKELKIKQEVTKEIIENMKENMRKERIQLYQSRCYFIEDCKKFHLQESYKGLKAGIWKTA